MLNTGFAQAIKEAMIISLHAFVEELLRKNRKDILLQHVDIDPLKDSQKFLIGQRQTYLDFFYAEGFPNDLDLALLLNGHPNAIPFLLYTSFFLLF